MLKACLYSSIFKAPFKKCIISERGRPHWEVSSITEVPLWYLSLVHTNLASAGDGTWKRPFLDDRGRGDAQSYLLWSAVDGNMMRTYPVVSGIGFSSQSSPTPTAINSPPSNSPNLFSSANH